eukprot:238227-Prymnesium_polylepis.1
MSWDVCCPVSCASGPVPVGRSSNPSTRGRWRSPSWKPQRRVNACVQAVLESPRADCSSRVWQARESAKRMVIGVLETLQGRLPPFHVRFGADFDEPQEPPVRGRPCWPMADVVAKGGIGSGCYPELPCRCGRWPMMSPEAVS